MYTGFSSLGVFAAVPPTVPALSSLGVLSSTGP
jgi:hypothetical protein